MDYLGQKNEIVKKLDSDSSRGLSKDLAAKRLEENGPNKIESKKKKSLGFCDFDYYWRMYFIFADFFSQKQWKKCSQSHYTKSADLN